MSVIFSFFSVSVHGHYGYVQILCRTDSQQNTEFIYSVTYNMIEYLRYNSTEDIVIGYTEFGKKWAEDYNKNKILLAQAEFALKDCKEIGKFIFPYAGTTGERHFLFIQKSICKILFCYCILVFDIIMSNLVQFDSKTRSNYPVRQGSYWESESCSGVQCL